MYVYACTNKELLTVQDDIGHVSNLDSSTTYIQNSDANSTQKSSHLLGDNRSILLMS